MFFMFLNWGLNFDTFLLGWGIGAILMVFLDELVF